MNINKNCTLIFVVHRMKYVKNYIVIYLGKNILLINIISTLSGQCNVL